ncbi:MAG: tellurite resistance TerB C-terminal domain-containing protein [Methylococcaceae bacterium]
MAILGMIRDAVKVMNGKASIPQIEQYFIENHPNIKIQNIKFDTPMITVNSHLRIHYNGGKKVRLTNTNNKYDCLFKNANGFYEIYDTKKHGIWEIYKNNEDKLSIRLAGDVTLSTEQIILSPPSKSEFIEKINQSRVTVYPITPPIRKSYETNKIIRNAFISKQIKDLYQYKCQICSTRLESGDYWYAEAAHIRALGEPHNGTDTISNILCLCPNHHKLFDIGGFYIEDNLTIPTLNTKLYKHPSHSIDLIAIQYHRKWSIESLEALNARVKDELIAMNFSEQFSTLGVDPTLAKYQMLIPGIDLESVSISIEPDILVGTKLTRPSDGLILFKNPDHIDNTPAYQVALLTIQLASIVASADGEFSANELNHLNNEIRLWPHLTPCHIRGLLAHLRILVTTQITIASVKNKIESLDISTRESIATFMANVAESDGTVTPNEVNILEKIYKALGVDTKKVFSNLHAQASDAKITAPVSTNIEEFGFKLNSARITMLQQDTDKVSKLLANIFNDQETDVTQCPKVCVTTEAVLIQNHILGLDSSHAAFARMLLSQPEWRREELLELATTFDLMLDGALEHINEAAFDIYDIPFTEGDDPIEINPEILEKIEA